jgi:hypothetical protein
MGFVVMGVIGYLVKLIHIPMYVTPSLPSLAARECHDGRHEFHCLSLADQPSFFSVKDQS